MKHILVLAIVLAVAVLAVPSALAQKVIAPDSVAYGRSYGEWSAAWEQWADSIPVAQHPLFDNGDCSVGQTGPVWFLGGKFCSNIGPGCSFTGVVRSCKVPAGKALYFPVFNGEDSALEENVAEHPGDESYQQIVGLRSFEDSTMSPSEVTCLVDGTPIPRLQERFRVQSTAFGFTLPTDNLFKSIYGNANFLPGTYFPAVDDGWYVMLAPLPAGPHQIYLRGFNPIYNFTLEVTYNLMVVK